MKMKFLAATLLLFAIMGAMTLWNAPHGAIMTARYLAVAALCGFGWTKRSNTTWILVFMVAGACLGHDFPVIGQYGRVPSMIFIRLVKTIVAPLLFAMLVRGIAQHSDIKKTGRLGVKAIIYFEVITTLALLIGLAAINISKAGVGVNLKVPQEPGVTTAAKVTGTDMILSAFPENIAKSVSEGKILQVVVFSFLFGIGLAMVPEEKRKPMLDFCDVLALTMFKFTKIVMYFAPVGVGGAMAYVVGHMGIGILVNLGKLLITLYLSIFVFIVCVLLPVALLFKVPIRRFVKATAEPVTVAFATTASEAAMPVALKNLEELGVSRRAASFVYPLGMSFNQDGASVYMTLAVGFVAQASGIHMTLGTQLLVLFALMLITKGGTGVPRGSLVWLMAMVAQFGLPVEPVFLLLGIDELMDMGRSGMNTLGNCLTTTIVAKWENDFQLTPEPQPTTAAASAAS
jgi:Na+/H+-dicarboxylate symporter